VTRGGGSVQTMAKHGLRFLGTPVSDGQLATIRDVVRSYGTLSRMELAATVCELFGWTRGNGKPKARECREWLEHLEASGGVVLPVKRAGRPVGSKTSVPAPAVEPEGVTGSVADVGPIRVECIKDAGGRRKFRELIGNYHYLGYRVPYGAQVRYLVYGERGEVLACLLFTSAVWRMAARDEWIGWDDGTRQRNLVRVVCNSRFLVLPWVRVKNLASAVLAQALRALEGDWRDAYGVTPLLVETLVDERRFRGTCYRAANFIDIGITAGRGRMDRHTERKGAEPKRIFLYPLRRDTRRLLAEN